jgi:hypothetical protein
MNDQRISGDERDKMALKVKGMEYGGKESH